MASTNGPYRASTNRSTITSNDFEIKTEPEVNFGGYPHSTSLLPAATFGRIKDAACHEENLQGVQNQTSEVLGSKEVGSFKHPNFNTVDVKQELDVNFGTPMSRTNLISDPRKDPTVQTAATTFDRNCPTRSRDSESVSGSSNAILKVKAEPVHLDNHSSHVTNSDAFNPPTASGISPVSNNSENLYAINNVPPGSSISTAFQSPQNDPKNSSSERFVSVKKEAVQHVSDVNSFETAPNFNVPKTDLSAPLTAGVAPIKDPRALKTEDCEKTEKSNFSVNKSITLVKEPTQMEHDVDMPCSEIQVLGPVKKIYPLIDLTSDHSSDSTRCSSPINGTSLQNWTLNGLSGALESLRTEQSQLEVSSGDTRFPTPMLNYLNLNRTLNISALTKLRDCLKNLKVSTSEEPSAKRLTDSKREIEVNSCTNSPVKRLAVEPKVDTQSEEPCKSPGIRASKVLDDNPLESAAYPATISRNNSWDDSVCHKLSPDVVMENTKIADVSCSDSTLLAAMVEAERLKNEVDFNEIKRAVEMLKSPQKIGNSTVVEADCTVVPMEIESDAPEQGDGGNVVSRQGLAEALDLSSEYLIDIIRNSTPSDSTENCPNASKHSNITVLGSYQNPVRCHSSDSLTSSTEQSESYETPPKRAKIDYNNSQGTKRIDINEYRMKKQSAFRVDNVSPLAMQSNLPKSSSHYVHYPVFSSQNSQPFFASPIVRSFSESVPSGNEFYPSNVGSATYSSISNSLSQTAFSTINPSTLPEMNSHNQINNIFQSSLLTSTLPIGQIDCTSLPLPSPLSNPSPPIGQEQQYPIPPPNVLSNVPPPVGQVRNTILPHSVLSNLPPPVRHVTTHSYQRYLPTSSTLLNLTQSAVQASPPFFRASNSFIQEELNHNPTLQADNPDIISPYSAGVSSSYNNLNTVSNNQFAPLSRDTSQRGRLLSPATFNDVQSAAEYMYPPLKHNDLPFASLCSSLDEFPVTPPLPPEPELPPLPSPEAEEPGCAKIPSPPRKSTLPSYFQPSRNALKPLPPRGVPTATSYSRTTDRKGASMLPSSLKSDIGKKYILTNDVYLIIIEWNVDWMLEIDKESTTPPISVSFLQVKNSYSDTLAYYNTYFPLLLLECWNKVCGALKRYRSRDTKKNHEWLCQIEVCDRKATFINISCVAIIPKMDVDSIPKDGNIILVRLPLGTTGSIKMLAYVHSSQHRAFSEKHDQNNKTLRNLKSTVCKLSKIRISFYIAFSADVCKDELIKLYKLTSIKNFLKQNDALTGLPKSTLSNIILNPLHYNIFQMSLPHRKNPEEMRHVVQLLSENVQTPSEQLFLLKYTPFSDPLLAMFRLAEELKKSVRRPKTLICVDHDALDHVGHNFIDLETFVILNRERDMALHESLKPFSFDRRIDELYKKSTLDQTMDKDNAHFEVLRKCDVILAVTTNSFYEDIYAHLHNKIDLEICIIYQAHIFTEPESVLPLQYGIKKLILIGDPEAPCKVSSRTAIGYDYNKSLFHRVYNCC